MTGLKNNTWYQLRVGAGNLAGDGPLSPPSAPVKTLALPAPVTNLRITEMTIARTRLDWRCEDACSKEATFFKVIWEPYSAELAAVADASSSGQTKINVTQQADADYLVEIDLDITAHASSSGIVFRIFSGSQQGQEDKGATITLPSAAQGLRVTSSTEFSLSFAWDPHPAADTFQVLFARPLREGEDEASAPPFRAAAPETQISSLTVAGLLTAVSYRFKVVSKVKDITPFEILGSNILEAAPSGLPLPPEGVRVTASFASQITLSWEAAATGPRPQRYRVLYARADAAGNPVEQYGRPIETTTTATTITGLGAILDGTLAQAVALQFRVFAGSHKEFEDAGSSVDLPLVSPIGPARSLEVSGSSSVPTFGAISISLSWLPPPDGDQPLAYRIRVTRTASGGEGEGETFDMADVLHVGARHALQSGLAAPLIPGRTYSFTLHSKSAEGFYEPAGSSAVEAAPLVVPTNLEVKSCSSSSVTVTWTLPPVSPVSTSSDGSANVGGVIVCPEGRVRFTQEGSIVTASSPSFPLSCKANESVTGQYTVQGLKNNVIYKISLEARRAQPQVGASSGGASVLEAYTPWVGTAGPNLVEASPISSPFALQIIGVTATSAMLTWRSGLEGVRAQRYQIEYTALSPAARQGVRQVRHVGGPGTIQQLNVTGLSPGHQYTIKVRAVSPSGIVAPYDGTPAITTPVATPTGILVAAVDAETVSFSWGAAGLQLEAEGIDAAPLSAGEIAFPTDLIILVERLSDGSTQTFGPFAALSSSASVGPLELGTRHRATIIARTASGDSVVPPEGSSVDCLPLPRPDGVRVSEISEAEISIAFRASMPWVC